MHNKFITLITLVAFTFVTLFSPFPGPAGKANAESNMLAQNTGSLRLVTATGNFSFKKDLMLGDTDPDVIQLQKVLNSDVDTMIATAGAGSPGQEGNYFGTLTKVAVIKFQAKYKADILTPVGLTAGNGVVGLLTRTKLNLLLGITAPTVASVGFPQSRAGSGTVSQPALSVCSFVDLLINIGAIPADKAVRARQAMGCVVSNVTVAPAAPASNSAICSFVNLLINVGVIASDKANPALSAMGCAVNGPSVTVTANGSRGPISVLPGTQFKLAWKSTDTKSCNDGARSLPVAGSVELTANVSMKYPIYCITNNNNNIEGDVTVIVSNNESSSSTIQVLSSQITPGNNYAVFEAVTNIPTKMLIAYYTDPNATASPKLYESTATASTHSEKITGLLPNTTYYARVGFAAGPDNSVMTDVLTFTTLSGSTNSEVAQRVLSSSGGSGVVSIPDSPSLKTDSQVTLEAWVKPTSWSTNVGMSNTGDSVIISKGNIGGNINYALSLDNGKLVYSNNDASLWTIFPVVPLNVWTHVAVSVNESSANISLYVNGVKQLYVSEGSRGVFSAAAKINKRNAITEAGTSVSINNNSAAGSWGFTPTNQQVQSLLPNVVPNNNVYLGNFYPAVCSATSTEGNGFIGLIDDVKIWNIFRTDAQIKADLASSTAATSTTSTTPAYTDSSAITTLQDPGLVGHWTFDDGRVTDLTYYVNNGALKGDMKVVADESAPSPIVGSTFAMNGLEFSFPEACDAGLYTGEATTTEETAGYKITFRGGVKSVVASGDYTNVELEACDNPSEELVKSVEVIGNAPPRDKSYYNNMGSISVAIAPGLGMKVPAERETIKGNSYYYISYQGLSSAYVQSSANSGANSVGDADTWQPDTKSCMKPKSEGLFGAGGTFAIVAAVVVIVASCIYTACTAAGAVIQWMATAEVAALGYTAGSMVQCDKGTVGCY